MLAKVFQQDSYNMPMVHKGLDASARSGVTLANAGLGVVHGVAGPMGGYTANAKGERFFGEDSQMPSFRDTYNRDDRRALAVWRRRSIVAVLAHGRFVWTYTDAFWLW